MASCGFDGFVRIWNLKTMEMDAMMEDRASKGRERVHQSIAWYPNSQGTKDNLSSLLAVATSTGSIKLFDTAKNRVIQALQIDPDKKMIIFDLDWASSG